MGAVTPHRSMVCHRYQQSRKRLFLSIGEERCALACIGRVRPMLAVYREPRAGCPCHNRSSRRTASHGLQTRATTRAAEPRADSATCNSMAMLLDRPACLLASLFSRFTIPIEIARIPAAEIMSRFTPALILAVLLLLIRSAPGAPAAAPKPAGDARSSMRTYPSRYYIIHTDLTVDDVKEAIIRMNKMAEEYHERTRGFSGEIRERLPFYLFRNADEYYAAGGIPGSAGVFRGGDLLAMMGDKPGPGAWHVVQHEGFHQFAAAVIRGQMPPWLNEGIAEYFGESIFTGDGFVSGIIPPRRLKRVQDAIRANQYKSMREMMLLSQSAWNS